MATIKRTVAAILLVTLMPQLAGCVVRTTQRIPPAQLGPDELGLPGSGEPRVVGVSTYDGRVVMFDSLPIVTAGQHVYYAKVRGVPDTIPQDAVARMWVARPGDRAVRVQAPSLGAAVTAASALTAPIVGVTLASGGEVRFDRPAPTHLAHDTVYATARGEPYSVALATVQSVWVLRTNTGLSILKSVGVLAGAALIVGGVIAVAYASSPMTF